MNKETGMLGSGWLLVWDDRRYMLSFIWNAIPLK